MFNGMNGLEILKNWPRFEDGEPVRVGDSAPFGTDGVMEVAGVEINRFGYVLHGSIDDGMRECVDGDDHGVAVKRPAPKLLDADGVEIELGDDLCSVEGGLKFHVSHIDRVNGKIATDAMFSLDKWADPSLFTHRAPVIAADGKPLREGETVWLTDGIEKHVVLSTEKDAIGNIVTEVQAPGAVKVHISPSRLTHELPESWERLEKDANAAVCTYFGASVKDCENCDHNSWECSYDKARDLVRRAKKLAGGA